MSHVIDCRGLACPEPVLRVKKELKNISNSQPITILVSSPTARDNVRRIVSKMGWSIKTEEDSPGYKLFLTK